MAVKHDLFHLIQENDMQVGGANFLKQALHMNSTESKIDMK